MKNNHNNNDENNLNKDNAKLDKHDAHKKALKEALAILGDYKPEPITNTSPTEESLDNSTSCPTNNFVNYQNVVETELKNLTNTVRQLQEENLENIAKIQTMARRHGEEEVQTRKYGGVKLAQDIIPALDLFKKILTMPVKNEEVKNYLMGFDMIAKQLDQVLANNGIHQIEVKVGDDFNPHLHEATEVIETENVPSGKIAVINSHGYKLHDRVIKHTSVKVAK
ncbi:molecular chaperone GrpE [Entomoplasma freundtii]|uniref:Protein GrpE n=1 Tax=Entomoplasma freundtii TaxID=74700 RepID=A0A2K8NRD2_9MOLU|nr:nucleotide exchange factor GrpE [Entomoplasma freundtii]ATZ16405.1 heat shock protein GrpE [Entomoplasma freundtii]TDY56556.1 molecular chaperone GrpE [Entomoplasma freundtii]